MLQQKDMPQIKLLFFNHLNPKHSI